MVMATARIEINTPLTKRTGRSSIMRARHGRCGRLPSRSPRNDVMNGGERMARHKTLDLSPFHSREEFGRRFCPRISLENHVEKDVDVQEEFHVPYFSRALEFELDTLNMTVTKVWEFAEDPLTYSRYMGNTQRLPNGNTLINWAVYNKPKLTEVRPDGSKAFEMDFKNGYDCYRTFRYPWKGKAIVPYLVIESWDDRVSLMFNKFGDTDVDHYNILSPK